MRKLILLVFAISICSAASAQMAKFQALYLFQFAKNTSWPQEDAGKPFVIAVIGDNSLSSELRTVVNNKKVGDRPVRVVESATASGLPKSDIIYLGESKSSQIGSLIVAQANIKALIVSGTTGQCAQVGGISFVPDGGKLQFEIHEGNIAKNVLKVTPKLVTLGRQVF